MADEPRLNNASLDYININDMSVTVQKPTQVVHYHKAENEQSHRSELNALRQIELDELNESYDAPRPGQYSGVYQNSAFVHRPSKYQRMGIGKTRWQERDLRLQKETNIAGPGAYEHNKSNSMRMFKNPSKSSFERAKRFPSQVRKSADGTEEYSPGPGAYHGQFPLVTDDSFNKGVAVMQFGSATKRFNRTDLNPSGQILPGPGEYRPEISREFLDNKRNEIMPQSAVFLMKKDDRESYINYRRHDSPSPTSYDPV